jgi:mRNA-degrading endonuclease RelE of RelBE toxin-antitoxin system
LSVRKDVCPDAAFRIGDYRIIYPVSDDDILSVVAVTSGQRRDVYDR